MWASTGHNTAKQLLEKQLKRGQFPHAYLFMGPQGIGKKLVATEMAKQILAVDRLDNHPDFTYYNAGNGSGMEELREFMSRLSTKPFLGQNKIVVIDDMEQANTQMSNALLKTLEEPTPSTILFVIANQNSILPTIVSRCQVLTFNPLSASELTQYAKQTGLESTEQLLASSAGSPGRLVQLINDTEGAGHIQAAVVKLEQIQGGATADRLLAVNELAELETQQLKDVLLAWLYSLRQTLSLTPENGQVISSICEALTHLNGSFNKKMVLQRLLLQTNEA